MKLKYHKGTPQRKGYYIVRCSNEKYRINKEKDAIGSLFWWNGTEWQNLSENDLFDEPGNESPLRFEPEIFDEYCEVEI